MGRDRGAPGGRRVLSDSRWLELTHDGERWRFDAGFLTSGWECIWGRGCLGIHDVPTPELGEGCCSLGAELLDDDEARLMSALAASMDPARFQHHADAASGVVVDDGGAKHTRVVDGACVFFNRPGFPGGAGCALHLSALDDGASPIDYKPSVCWQLPIKVDRTEGRPAVRPWRRTDWGEQPDLAWCCSNRDEAPEAFAAPTPLFERLEEELEALLGPALSARLRRELDPGSS